MSSRRVPDHHDRWSLAVFGEIPRAQPAETWDYAEVPNTALRVLSYQAEKAKCPKRGCHPWTTSTSPVVQFCPAGIICFGLSLLTRAESQRSSADSVGSLQLGEGGLHSYRQIFRCPE
jgi:hypothetical protein